MTYWHADLPDRIGTPMNCKRSMRAELYITAICEFDGLAQQSDAPLYTSTSSSDRSSQRCNGFSEAVSSLAT